MARAELIRSHPVASVLIGVLVVVVIALVLSGAIGGRSDDESGVALGGFLLS